MTDKTDLLELEIAFTAFAKTIIGTVLAIDPGASQELIAALRRQTDQLRDAEHFQAAHVLERLAASAVQQTTALALLLSETDNDRPI